MQFRLHYAGNLFFKEVELEHAGDVLPGHSHYHDHLSYLAAGEVAIEIEGSTKQLKAPAVLLVKKDKLHRIVAVGGPARWLCVHALRDVGGELLDPETFLYTDDSSAVLAVTGPLARS